MDSNCDHAKLLIFHESFILVSSCSYGIATHSRACVICIATLQCLYAVTTKNYHIPYSRKISRAKIFEVGLPQNILRIKFRGSTRLALHLYAIIRFRGLIFEVAVKSTKTAKFIVLEKFPLYGSKKLSRTINFVFQGFYCYIRMCILKINFSKSYYA